MRHSRIFTAVGFMALVVFACADNPYKQGKILYTNFCERCHMEDGTGLRGIIPPLAGADFLKNHQEELPCIIRYGMKGPVLVNGQTYNTEMPGEPKLTEFEITNIINYINTAWGNDAPLARHPAVRNKLEECEAAARGK